MTPLGFVDASNLQPHQLLFLYKTKKLLVKFHLQDKPWPYLASSASSITVASQKIVSIPKVIPKLHTAMINSHMCPGGM